MFYSYLIILLSLFGFDFLLLFRFSPLSEGRWEGKEAQRLHRWEEMRSSNALFGVRFFLFFYLTLDHCYLRLSLWIIVLTRFGVFRVQMALCWNLWQGHKHWWTLRTLLLGFWSHSRRSSLFWATPISTRWCFFVFGVCALNVVFVLTQLAGVVAVEVTGGPEVPFHPGREV